MREFETIRDFFTSATMAALIDLFFVFFIVIIAVIAGPLAIIPLLAIRLWLGVVGFCKTNATDYPSVHA